MNFVKHIPNLLTLANLAMGCIAIVLFSESHYMMLDYNPAASDYTVRFFSENLVYGTFFVFYAIVFDFFDGLVARWLGVQSAIGEYLDSLSDVVSFGVAPGVLLYQLLKYSWANYKEASIVPQILLLPALLIPLAAAYRLAKFNAHKQNQYNYFMGLPTPAAAIAVIALPWASISIEPIRVFFNHPLTIYLIILVLSFLMVAKQPMCKLSLDFKNKKNLTLIIILGVVSVLAFFQVAYLAAFLGIVIYIILSLVLIKENK